MSRGSLDVRAGAARLLMRIALLGAVLASTALAWPASAEATTLLKTTVKVLGQPVLSTELTAPIDLGGAVLPEDPLGQGLGETLAGLACDPVRRLTAPLGDLATGVSALLCDLDLLDYTVYTTFRRPDGSLVRRETRANVAVPTLVEVGDGTLLPDLLVTFTPDSTSKFTFKIARAPLQVGQLPVSVEAVFNDPTKGDLPRQRLAFGYDARQSRAPQEFETVAQVGKSAVDPDAATLALRYTTKVPGASLDVIGGVFDGTTGNRTDPVGARLSYTPMPARAGIALVLGSKHLAMRKTTSAPTRLTVDYEDVKGPAEVRARAVADRLPAWVETTYDRPAANRREVTYAAAAGVDTFNLDYTDSLAGDVQSAATLQARGLPTGMAVEQTSAKAGTFEATGGSLGRVEVGYSENGLPRLLAGATTPYGYVVEQGPLESYAGRVDGLVRASFDASRPIVVDAEIAARTPFVAKVDTPELELDGRLEDLPRRVRAVVDPDKGKVDYDGFGDPIGLIEVEALSPTAFFDRVRYLQGRIRQLPPQVTVEVLSSRLEGLAGEQWARKGVDMNASAPIGSIEATMKSDPADPIPPGVGAGRQGASVVDTRERFAAFGRINGLREARYLGPYKLEIDLLHRIKQPIPGTGTPPEKTPHELHLVHAGGPFDLRYEEEGYEDQAGKRGDKTIVAAIDDLPARLDLIYDEVAAKASLDASAGIGRASVKRKDAEPFVGPADRLELTLRGIPQKVDLTLPREGAEKTVVEASRPLGRVDFLLTSLPESEDLSHRPPGNPDDPGESGLWVQSLNKTSVTLGERLVVSGRVNGFRRFSFGTDVGLPKLTEVGLDLAAPQRLKARAMFRDGGSGGNPHQPTSVELDVDRLPASFTADLSDAFGFRWNASDGIDSLKLTANDLPGSKTRGVPRFVDARLARLPKQFSIGLAGSVEARIGLTSASDPIGEVEVDVSDTRLHGTGGLNLSPLPDDRNTLRVVTKDDGGGRGGLHVARLRAFDLRQAAVRDLGGTLASDSEFGSSPKPLDVFIDGFTYGNLEAETLRLSDRDRAEIRVSSPPRKLRLQLRADGKVVRAEYDAHGEEVPELRVLAWGATCRQQGGCPNTFESSATDVVVKDLPPRLEFCLTTEGQFAGLHCEKRSPDDFRISPPLPKKDRNINHFFNDVTATLKTPGATKRVRLERMYHCGKAPILTELIEDGAQCLRGGDEFNFISITNLRARGFNFEFASKDECCDIIKLYLDTDLEEGLNVDRVEVWDKEENDRLLVHARNLAKPVRANDFFIAVDTGAPCPSTGLRRGTLEGDIEIRAKIKALGVNLGTHDVTALVLGDPVLIC